MPPITSIYFAGPDVFRCDVAVWRARVVKLCAEHGITPVLPCDGTESDPESIRQANLQRLRSSSAVIANLNPFRGVEVDTGTAFEVGYACALQKPVVGYVGDPEPLEQRVGRLCGPLSSDVGIFSLRDRDGFGVEAFSLPTNLMIASGVPIVAGDEADALARLLSGEMQS